MTLFIYMIVLDLVKLILSQRLKITNRSLSPRSDNEQFVTLPLCHYYSFSECEFSDASSSLLSISNSLYILNTSRLLKCLED